MLLFFTSFRQLFFFQPVHLWSFPETLFQSEKAKQMCKDDKPSTSPFPFPSPKPINQSVPHHLQGITQFQSPVQHHKPETKGQERVCGTAGPWDVSSGDRQAVGRSVLAYTVSGSGEAHRRPLWSGDHWTASLVPPLAAGRGLNNSPIFQKLNIKKKL